MVLSDDDQLNKNALMFIYLRENKPIQDKITIIESILKDGADVNAKDRNNNDNTPLHIAAQRAEKVIVQLLLDNGALLFHNKDGKGKTPLDIAKSNDSTIGKEIAELLELYGKYPARPDRAVEQQEEHDPPKNRQNNNKGNKKKKDDYYMKRAGTSGVSGQFYETKLLSLVLLRSLDDIEIEHFLLATNIRDIGDFDDVCFRYKLKHQDKQVMVFLQAKHRDDPDKGKLTVMNVQSASGDFGLAKYFDSFLKIRNKFSPDNPDPMFKGDFRDLECYFILYTSLKENFNDTDKCEIHPMCTKMHEIIYTGEKQGTFQYNYGMRDVDFLTHFILEERVKSMGLVFLDFILSCKERHDVMMTNNFIKIFHPALAHKVLSVSEIKPENYRWGHFREEFFDSDENILITLKETLCKAIVINYCKETTLSKEEILTRINEILNRPCPQTISCLIGDVLIFDEKKSKLILNESYIPQELLQKEDIVQIKSDLQKLVIVPATIIDAIVLAGRLKLKSLKFKLPATFGNSDLSVRGNEKKVASRINFLAKKFAALIDKYKDTKNIEIGNETVGPEKILDISTLETNGGIGGAVGNLLIFDSDNDMLVFNTEENTLPDKAKTLLRNIKSETSENLSTFKIKVNIEVFPKISFHANHYDKSLAQEFLNKLWFYTGQAKEDEVERILKNEINSHCNADKSQDQFLFHVHSDAIFLRFHDEIQKWWKTPTKAQYLTKNDKVFDEAKNDIIDRPLLTVLNVMCVRQIKKIGVEFKPEAVKSLEFDNLTQGFHNVISDAVILSTAKIMQFAKDPNNYIFINLDYILQLPLNDYKTMIDELKGTKTSTLVIINELAIASVELRENLNNIITNFNGNKIIIVADNKLKIESQKWSSQLIILNDECVNLTDMTPASQSKCLKDYKIIYQGQEVELNTVIDDSSRHLVRAKLLRKLLNNEKIEIGHAVSNPKYEQIKDYYMNRPLIYDGEELQVGTFNDIKDNIVVIKGKPCMGKTTLLTHLSLETKKIDPRPWIVRINLSPSKEFDRWQDKTIKINEVVKFLGKAALKNPDEINKVKVHTFDDQTVFVSCTEDCAEVSFELELFIHFFNNNEIIILFDGFDRIYSHNARECVALFKLLNQANKRLWITTSSYFSKLLEREFGTSYKLEQLSMGQQKSFLHSFWKTNLKLEKLNHDQFHNFTLFFKFVCDTLHLKTNITEENRKVVTIISVPLHIVYVAAVEHFKSEFSLSPKHIREKLKKIFNYESLPSLGSFFGLPKDRELDEDHHPSELAGTPLLTYMAASYLEVQIKDKLDFVFNTDEIKNKLGVYINALTLCDRFVKSNMSEICKIENKSRSPKTMVSEQEKLRDEFIKKHKMLALYTICKESDVAKLMTAKEISEVQTTIQRIESGEEESELIDCVIDGIPRFHNFLFAEYFLVEFATNMLKAVHANDVNAIRLESMLDCVVNVLLLASPPGVRNAFEYKLKYDPELMEAATDSKCQKTIFNLLLKEEMRGSTSDYDAATTLDTAINEGFVNISRILLSSVKNNITNESMDVFTRLLKSGVLVLSVVEPSWKEIADTALESLPVVRDAAQSLDPVQIEGISRAVVTLCSNTESGKQLSETIKTRVCEPVKTFIEKNVNMANNENLNILVEQLSYRLPDIVNTLFGNMNMSDQ